MCSISSSPSQSCFIYLNMSNLAFIKFKSLSFDVLLNVLQKVNDVSDWFFWPSSVVFLHVVGLSLHADSSKISSEWNNLLVFEDISQVVVCILKHFSSDGSGYFESVLVAASKVLTSRFCWFSLDCWLSWIPDHILYNK